MNVSLLVTCLGDALFPQIGVATVRLLRRLGVGVDFPQAQTCCGQPHFNSGYHDEARLLARHPIETFARSGLVVAPSGSCAAMVKLEYPELFHDDPVWHPRAMDLADRTHELSGFLVHVLGVEDVGARFEARAWPVLVRSDAEPVFALFFEAAGLGATGREPYRTLVPQLVDALVQVLPGHQLAQ